MISKKLTELEIAILEKRFDRALALLVEIFAAIVALSAGSALPFIQWAPRASPAKKRRKSSDNDLIIDAIRIAALASNRIPEFSGDMVCPKCGGILNWSVHQNGRIWGTCETSACLTFME